MLRAAIFKHFFIMILWWISGAEKRVAVSWGKRISTPHSATVFLLSKHSDASVLVHVAAWTARASFTHQNITPALMTTIFRLFSCSLFTYFPRLIKCSPLNRVVKLCFSLGFTVTSEAYRLAWK